MEDDLISEPLAGRPPAHLAELPASRIVDVDVREELRGGREPFARIMAARKALPADGVMRVRAIFEPVPLYAVMERQGLAHWTERLADDDWRVWFHPPIVAGGCRRGVGRVSRVGAVGGTTRTIPWCWTSAAWSRPNR
jgi:hypothetical protein